MSNMNDLYIINSVSPDGRVDFTFLGDKTQEEYEVSIIDNNFLWQ